MADKLTPEEQMQKDRKENRANGLIRLQNKYFRGLTAAKLGSHEQYGALLKDMYKTVVSKKPDALAYDELFKARLLNGEAVTSDSLKNDASGLLQRSLADITVKDVYLLMGIRRDVQEDYTDKIVSELTEEEETAVFSVYFGNLADEHASSVLGERTQVRQNGLEKMFGVPDPKQEAPTSR